MSAKDQIIKILKDSGSLSTSRIAGIIGIDYIYATKLLEELFLEKIIEKIETQNSTYWKIKETKNEI